MNLLGGAYVQELKYVGRLWYRLDKKDLRCTEKMPDMKIPALHVFNPKNKEIRTFPDGESNHIREFSEVEMDVEFNQSIFESYWNEYCRGLFDVRDRATRLMLGSFKNRLKMQTGMDLDLKFML